MIILCFLIWQNKDLAWCHSCYSSGMECAYALHLSVIFVTWFTVLWSVVLSLAKMLFGWFMLEYQRRNIGLLSCSAMIDRAPCRTSLTGAVKWSTQRSSKAVPISDHNMMADTYCFIGHSAYFQRASAFKMMNCIFIVDVGIMRIMDTSRLTSQKKPSIDRGQIMNNIICSCSKLKTQASVWISLQIKVKVSLVSLTGLLT